MILISDGNFYISVINGNVESASSTIVHCYKIVLTKENDKLTITSTCLPSFYLCGGAGGDIPGKLVEIGKTKRKQ